MKAITCLMTKLNNSGEIEIDTFSPGVEKI